MKKTIVVNLCAGPGAGKSTMAAHIFALLKWAGVDCELATEYAKDKVWEESFGVFKSQPYVFGKQFHKINRLIGKVDVVITDSPLILSALYDNTETKTFEPYVAEAFHKFNNMTYFVERKKEYNPNGRMQTATEAKVLDRQMRALLDLHEVQYKYIEGSPEGVDFIVQDVLTRLGGKK